MARATPREALDLPDADGPSTAITIPFPVTAPSPSAEILTPSRLPAYWPSGVRQRGNQCAGGLRPDRELGHAERGAGRVLDADVLDVDAGRGGRREQPGQFTGLVAEHDLDGGEGAGRSPVLAGNAGHPGPALVQQPGQLLV